MNFSLSIHQRYVYGVAWFLLSLCVCETNDVVMKYLNASLSPMQIVFGRFFFGTIVLLPVVICTGVKQLHTRCLCANISRGVLLFLGMLIWCCGLRFAKLNVACLINFTTPMFTLLLAAIFLGERISRARWIITVLGFGGVCIVLHPSGDEFNIYGSLLFLLSALFFAGLDILNKKLVTKETMVGSLFYTSCFTALLSLPMACMYWTSAPEISDILLLLWLGIGANLLLFCILKSFHHIDVSVTAPFRYVELVLASVFGYIFFDETLSANTILGAVIIIPSVIYLVRSEVSTAKKNKNTCNCSCC